ncbi:hypothetical protein NQ176_g773 [Zarea fungicola]|uniref:Uncharacterized protein n=1 Tax=Zarea fungicola TaxID=93591 RepID=A0ACC1NWM3_9HYPO|nr:hypothetical protein NQ176_g773 [Lecanicillium fungicola]
MQGWFAHDPALSSASVTQVPQAARTVEPPLSAQQTHPHELQQPRDVQKSAQEDERLDNCQVQAWNAVGRRRRPIQPRFSKNGKRLGRPPKPDDTGSSVVASTKSVNDSGASERAGGDNSGTTAPSEPVGYLGNDDSDPHWRELANARQVATNTTSKKRIRGDIRPLQNDEISATDLEGAVNTDMDRGQAEAILQKLEKEFIDRTVGRATMAEEQDEGVEGRRRSGRERKKVNFGEQVSWERVAAERRANYKIKMHLRALSVQARQERKKKEEEAKKAAGGKREAEELATAATADSEVIVEPSALNDSILAR